MPLNHSTPLFSARCALSPARTAAWPTSRTTPQPRATIRAVIDDVSLGVQVGAVQRTGNEALGSVAGSLGPALPASD